MHKTIFTAVFATILSAPIFAQEAPNADYEVGRTEFKRYSELSSLGYEPIAVGGGRNAVIGLINGEELYICFLADTPELSEERQSIVIDHIKNGAPKKDVPKIPLICVEAE